MSEQMEITTKSYAVKDVTVKPAGNSGRVYVPKSWIHKKVRVILIEPIEHVEGK